MLKNRTLTGSAISVFLMMVGVGMAVAILPQKVIQLTGSGNSVGFLASSFAISFILFQIPISIFADKVGIKPILSGGYCLCFCIGILYYFSNTPLLIFIGRFLQGLGEVPVWALAPALLSIQYPRAKGKAIGIYNASFHLGLTIGPLLGIILAKVFPGNQLFLVYAICCLTGALVIQMGIKNIQHCPQTNRISFDWNKLIGILSKPMAMIILLGITLYGAWYGTFITVIPVFLIETKGFDSLNIGLFFSAFYIGVSLSQIITGPLSDIFGRVGFMLLGLILAIAALFSFPYFDSHWIIIVLGISSLGLGMFFLASLAYLYEMVPDSMKASISGAYFLFWGMGYFSGPLIINKLEISLGTGRGFFSFLFLLLCEVFLLFVFKRICTDTECPKLRRL
ncbi:MAG: MFS transporter [Desulfobacteraceae bacterium]|nr:MFS transporter [Desulfobacteraceae bacterium]